MGQTTYRFTFAQYDQSKMVSEQVFPLEEKNPVPELEVSLNRENTAEGSIRSTCTVRVQKKIPYPAGVGIRICVPAWKKENYVFAPAALYNGNRFTAVERSYAPAYTQAEREASGEETFITDVPRLDPNGGRAQLNSGDLATPCVGYFAPESKTGYLLFFEQRNSLGNLGLTLDEDLKAGEMAFTISAPCVREKKYEMCTTKANSDDRGARLKKGDCIVLNWEEFSFPCADVTEFLRTFFKLRIRPETKRTYPMDVPWSRAYRLIESKNNAHNWVENPRFYKLSEAGSGIYSEWQTGWVGGTMSTLPGMIVGDETTRSRSRETLDFVFDQLQSPSGFLYGIFCGGKLYGDDFSTVDNYNIVMSRKNADALYFLIRHLLWMEHEGQEIPEKWRTGSKKLADAFVSFYRKWGEISQLIDVEHFCPYVRGTSAASIAPAGLALSARFFKDDSYLECAEELAEQFYQRDLTHGYTNGGPGEILGCPDSESAFALLESFVVLHAEIGKEKWLHDAEDAAALCASWCVSYDYHYERNTQFARRGVATTGAVWANVQNKHAAPGICTLAGSSLFRLYRETGEMRYLELCKDISHNITQYVSTPENPMYASYVWGGPPAIQKWFNGVSASILYRLRGASAPIFNPIGRINERANLSDWEGSANVGEVPHGSCWCEVSAMLTWLEIPAAYIQPDTGFCFAMDHLECSVQRETADTLTVELRNPTAYDAEYRLFVENSTERTRPIEDMCLEDFRIVRIAAHASRKLDLPKRSK